MKSNLIYRVKFYLTIINTKATILKLYLNKNVNKEYITKVKLFESALDKSKEFLWNILLPFVAMTIIMELFFTFWESNPNITTEIAFDVPEPF